MKIHVHGEEYDIDEGIDEMGEESPLEQVISLVEQVLYRAKPFIRTKNDGGLTALLPKGLLEEEEILIYGDDENE